MKSVSAILAYVIMRAGDIAGFGTVESGAVTSAIRRMLIVAGFGAVLAAAGPLVGIPVFAGLAMIGLAFAALAGGLMLAAQMNQELATILAMPPEPVAPPVPKTAPVAEPVAPPALVAAPARGSRRPLQVLSRGEIEGRAYAVFMDGSIEIETIFGPRWFASVDLAHEFIGYRKGGAVPVSLLAAAS